jgi:hypothetical protein
MSIFQGWQAARTVLQIGRGGKKQNYRPKNVNFSLENQNPNIALTPSPLLVLLKH